MATERGVAEALPYSPIDGCRLEFEFISPATIRSIKAHNDDAIGITAPLAVYSIHGIRSNDCGRRECLLDWNR